MPSNSFPTPPTSGAGLLAERIFAPLDAAHLQAAGLLTSATDGEHWNLECNELRRRLNRSSEQSSSTMDSDQSLVSDESDIPARDCPNFAQVPVDLISQHTLRYIGFSSTAATTIFARFRNLSDYNMEIDGEHLSSVELLRMAHRVIMEAQDCHTTSDDWDTCLLHMGIDVRLRNSIMHPDGDFWRYTQSASYWAREFTETRWLELRVLQQSSAQESFALGGTIVPEHILNGASVVEIAKRVARENAPLEGLTLYKGIAQSRLAGFLDNEGHVADWSTILSEVPTDLSWRKAYYFSPHFEAAERYIQWVRRNQAGPVVMISIVIPEELLRGRDIPLLQFPNPLWMELVWTCRRGLNRPRHLRAIQSTAVLIGDIATHQSSAYTNMASWNLITIRDLLFLRDGTKALQWKFSDEDGEDLLREFCSASVRVVFVRT